jgi:N-acetylmuramoyl-L-alanine amidase
MIPEPKIVEKIVVKEVVKKDTLYVPTVESAELVLLAKLIHSEARGEPLRGKVAVSTVVLNRLRRELKNSPSLKDIIYQKRQFCGVKTKAFKSYDFDCLLAAKTSFDLCLLPDEALYFANKKTATNQKFLSSIVEIESIAKHTFYKKKKNAKTRKKKVLLSMEN